MNPLLRNLTPSATDQIRAEHAQVLLAFHQFHAAAPAATKRALQRTIAQALERHAEIEEELLYPAVREVLAAESGTGPDMLATAPGTGLGAPTTASAAATLGALPEKPGTDLEVLDRSLPAHAEMRRLLDELQSTSPADPAYDRNFLALMREVMHHVADEESVLLPAAERLPADRFDALGAAMAQRRLQRASRRAGEVTSETLRALPTSALFMAAGVVLTGGLLARRALQRRAR